MKNFLIGSGYVESGMFTYLSANCVRDFKTINEGMQDLVNAIKSFIGKESGDSRNACCLKNKEKYKSARFCMQCGHEIVFGPREPDNDEVIDWFSQLMRMDCDSFGEGYDFFQEKGWEFGREPEDDVAIVYSFDQWLNNYDRDMNHVVTIKDKKK
jgi:hypothetical protein